MNDDTSVQVIPQLETKRKTVLSGQIVTHNDFLRQPSSKVKTVREGLEIARSLWTQLDNHNARVARLHKAYDGKGANNIPGRGIGLAAPQLGILKRVCIINYNGQKLALVNPEITEWSETKFKTVEGCLSLPGQYEEVYRYCNLEIRCDNIKEPMFFDAECPVLCSVVQHEIAHLHGKLIDDFTVENYPPPWQWDEQWIFKGEQVQQETTVAA